MTSLLNRNKLNIVNISQMKYLSLQECQQLCLDLDKAHREIVSLNQKLCHARRNLEDEKRKCRVIEHHKNLLERQINSVREVLFNNEANLNDAIKEKLHFLNNKVEIRYNNLHVQNKHGDRHLTTIAETDSTGSILSDLNYLSKSEDDLDTEAIIKSHKQKEWREYKPSEPCNTLHKVVEFYSPNRATITRVKPNDDAHTSIEIAFNKENIEFKPLNTGANHNFVSKMIIKPETCTPCGKRIRFGKVAIKCKDCLITCHTECKIKVLLLSCV